MKQLLFALLFIPTLLMAQVDQRYLANAVPMENGKVVFKRTLEAPSFSKKQLYERLLEWGRANYATETNRVVFQNEENGEIAIVGEDYLVFSSTALSLDRALMKYRVIIECQDGSCALRLTGIRYEYNVSYQEEPERYNAEEWITDEYALNKNKTKLNRISGKFRRATIDFATKTFDSAAGSLGAQLLTTPATAQATEAVPAAVPTAKAEPAAPAPEGFVAFSPDKVPETILQMLPDSPLRLTDTKKTVSEGQTEWKGIGNLLGKTICTISLPANSPAIQAIGTNGTYRLLFSKADASDNDPWIIIECQKQGETTEGEQISWIGAITHVWIK